MDGRWCGEHLNHKAVGEYLGSIGGRDDEGREFQRGVLRAYASSFDFQGLSLIPSLRAFLAEFRLPGEAQVIDRVMGGFSDTYVRDNPGVFSSPDVAYVLAFAAIMLNTDLHKSGVKRKMTREQFVSNMRGLEAGGKDLSQSLLQEVYGDIAKAPLALDTDPSFLTFFRPARQGWLLKRCTGSVPRWKRRFFLLADGVLYYFSTQGDVTTGRPRCILPLDEAALQVVGSLAFRLVPRAVVVAGEGGGGHPPSTPLKGGGGGVILSAPLSGTTPVAPSSPLPPFPSPSVSSGGGVSLLGGGHHPPLPPPLPPHRPPLSSITEALKCAKRNKDGSVKRSTRAHFELQASTPQERDEWAEAIAAQLLGAWGGGGASSSSSATMFSTPSKQPHTPARHDGASPLGVSGGVWGGGAAGHSSSSTAPPTSSQSTAPQGSIPSSSSNSQGTGTLGGGLLPLPHRRVSFSGSPSLRALAVSVVSAFPPTPPPLELRGSTSQDNLLDERQVSSASPLGAEKGGVSSPGCPPPSSHSPFPSNNTPTSGAASGGVDGGAPVVGGNGEGGVDDSDLSSLEGDVDEHAFEVAEEVVIPNSRGAPWFSGATHLGAWNIFRQMERLKGEDEDLEHLGSGGGGGVTGGGGASGSSGSTSGGGTAARASTSSSSSSSNSNNNKGSPARKNGSFLSSLPLPPSTSTSILDISTGSMSYPGLKSGAVDSSTLGSEEGWDGGDVLVGLPGSSSMTTTTTTTTSSVSFVSPVPATSTNATTTAAVSSSSSSNAMGVIAPPSRPREGSSWGLLLADASEDSDVWCEEDLGGATPIGEAPDASKKMSSPTNVGGGAGGGRGKQAGGAASGTSSTTTKPGGVSGDKDSVNKGSGVKGGGATAKTTGGSGKKSPPKKK